MYKIFLFLFIPILCFCQTFDVRETFEKTGVSTNWTEVAGTANWDTTAALEGGHSVRLETTNIIQYAIGTDYSEIWVHFILEPLSGLGTANGTFYLRDISTALCYFNVTADTVCKFYHGTNNSTGSTVLTNTTHYFWVHYVKGTGSNGTAELYFSTDGDIPASPEVSLTAGTSTDDVGYIRFNTSGAGWRVVLDDVIADADSIGNYSAQQRDYYVDATSGVNDSSGTASTRPWQTIAKVNGWTFNAGDNIYLKRGETWREQLTVPSSGTSGNRISFDAYGSGADPIVRGDDVVDGWTNVSGNKWYYLGISTDPRVINFRDTLGTEAANSGAVDAEKEWFWTDDTLFIYSSDTTNIGYSVRNAGLNANGQDYLNFSNIHVKFTRNGISYLNGCNNITYDNMSCSYTGNYAIYMETTCSDITMTNSTLTGSGEIGQGIMLYSNGNDTTRGFTFSNNTINGNGNSGGIGISILEADTCTISDIVISGNSITNTDGGSGAIKVYDAGGYTGKKYFCNVRIDSNTIYSAASGGIYLKGAHSDSGITYIRNNTIYSTSTASTTGGMVIMFSDSVYVENNLVYNNSTNGIDGCGVDFDLGVTNSVMRYNTIYGHTDNDGSSNRFQSSSGIMLFAEADVNGTDSLNTGNDVYYNILYDNIDGIKVCGDNVTNTDIYNNVCYSNDSTGVIIKSALTGSEFNVKNNILSENDYGLGSEGSLDPDNDYNCIYGNTTGGTNNITIGTNSITGNPLFTDATNADFTLTASSPCVDAGTDVSLTLDFSGNTVPYPVNQVLVDIGAYEYLLGLGVPNLLKYKTNYRRNYLRY